MTRKDYIAIASSIRNAHRITREVELQGEDPEYILGAEQVLDLLADELADKFQVDNELFSRGKFLDACKHHRDSDGR